MNTVKDSTLARFKSRVKIVNDCWLWQGRLDRSGYGEFDWSGKTNKAHIYSFRTFVCDVPKGKELDHLCRNRNCVNPEHLEPVSHAENMRRGQWARQTACQNGHKYTQETLYINKTSGQRTCRICRAEYNRQYRLRQKEKMV